MAVLPGMNREVGDRLVAHLDARSKVIHMSTYDGDTMVEYARSQCNCGKPECFPEMVETIRALVDAGVKQGLEGVVEPGSSPFPYDPKGVGRDQVIMRIDHRTRKIECRDVKDGVVHRMARFSSAHIHETEEEWLDEVAETKKKAVIWQAAINPDVQIEIEETY